MSDHPSHCSSCEEVKPTIPVMFPASPAANAPLVRHWWCDECASAWLGDYDHVIATTGVVESCKSRGYREVM